MQALFGVQTPPTPRNDLVTIFLTGIPGLNQIGTSPRPSEMLRLNTAIPPSARPHRLGVLAGDLAGFPNGRRVGDDVVDIALQAMAGATPLTPDFVRAPNNRARRRRGPERQGVPAGLSVPDRAARGTGDRRGAAASQYRLSQELPMKTWLIVLAAVVVGGTRRSRRGVRLPTGLRRHLAAAALPRVQGTLACRSRCDVDASPRRAWPPTQPMRRRPSALAEILLRKARVDRNGGYAMRGGTGARDAARSKSRAEYSALKMLGAVYVSQHRFEEAIAIAHRAIAVQQKDAWNYGTLGDAYLELGQYERAFDAFDTMVRLRPDAASYARVAYAHELQGQLSEALRLMRMAAEATSAHDPESLAWHHAQIGNILLKMGDVDGAAREFARADYLFPGHPDARDGRARIRETSEGVTTTNQARDTEKSVERIRRRADRRTALAFCLRDLCRSAISAMRSFPRPPLSPRPLPPFHVAASDQETSCLCVSVAVIATPHR